MSAFDSEAVFADRLSDFGMGEYQVRLKELGVNSFSTLAFLTSYIPGKSSEDEFVEKLVKPILGVPSPYQAKSKTQSPFAKTDTLCLV